MEEPCWTGINDCLDRISGELENDNWMSLMRKFLDNWSSVNFRLRIDEILKILDPTIQLIHSTLDFPEEKNNCDMLQELKTSTKPEMVSFLFYHDLVQSFAKIKQLITQTDYQTCLVLFHRFICAMEQVLTNKQELKYEMPKKVQLNELATIRLKKKQALKRKKKKPIVASAADLQETSSHELSIDTIVTEMEKVKSQRMKSHKGIWRPPLENADFSTNALLAGWSCCHQIAQDSVCDLLN